MEVEEVIAFFFHFEEAGGLGGFFRCLRLSLASSLPSSVCEAAVSLGHAHETNPPLVVDFAVDSGPIESCCCRCGFLRRWIDS